MFAPKPESFLFDIKPIQLGRLFTPPRVERATIDFETRSVADLKRCGAWIYSKHPSTEILVLRYLLPGDDPRKPKIWHRAHPDLGIEESPLPLDLFAWIAKGGKVEAHNAGFEQYIWLNVAVARMGWPAVADDQWLCSAAKAAAHALPRSLEGACDALNLPINKDPRGKALIRKFSKPKRLTKAERELWGDDAIIWNEDEELRDFWEYCGQDVRAEHRLSETLPDLSPMEQKVWQITQDMNRRGVLLDLELVHAAIELAGKAKAKANAELKSLTGIASGTQRAAIKAWLEKIESLELPDTKAKTIEWYLERGGQLSKRARRVLEIVKDINRASTSKFQRMLDCVDDDDRARELLVYCGAERTGRFAGKGIQVHNFPKGKFAKHLPKKTAMDIACEDVKSRDLEWCEAIHGDVMNLLASVARGAIIAPAGRDLMTADYAAIEARCILWEAGATLALEVFRQGKDIYCDMASGIYGREITKENVKTINAQGATERDFGKVAVLGLGYGMGWLKFLITLRTYNIRLTRAEVLQAMGQERLDKYEAIVRKKLFPQQSDYTQTVYVDLPQGGTVTRKVPDEKKFKLAEREASINRRKLRDEREEPEDVIHELALCKYTVDTYRSRYPEVKAMWKAQEEAAIRAVRTGKAVKCGVVTWKVVGRFLKCRLPSGRCLNYCDPHLKSAKTSWGEVKPSLRFWAIDQKTKRWTRQASYGGKLTENITQAIARDVMAFAQIAIEERGTYELLMNVHDQIVSEVDEDAGDKDEFESLMCDLPACMEGCPITAEPERYKRYRK